MIQPFPKDVDRVAFGHWLSGFADGEACFVLNFSLYGNSRRVPKARFHIGLREDDSAILATIQSYLQCGRLEYHHTERQPTRNNNPQRRFIVCRSEHLWGVIVPHFEAFPLRAKKRREFAYWREGVALMQAAHARPFTYIARRDKGVQRLPRWRDTEVARFAELIGILSELREYRAT